MTSELKDRVKIIKETYYSDGPYISPNTSLNYSDTLNSFTGTLGTNNE
jgi:hypothetical protein